MEENGRIFVVVFAAVTLDFLGGALLMEEEPRNLRRSEPPEP